MAASGLSGFYGSVFKRSTTASILVRNGSGLVLILRTGSGEWNLPAGIVKGGEDPRSAARRLLRDALGRDLDIGRVLVLDYVQAGGPPAAAGRPGSSGDSITFLFDGGALASSVSGFTAGGGEREARFVAVPECAVLLGEASAARVAAALAAQELGTVTELVDGRPAFGEPSAVPPLRRMMPPVLGFSGILGR